MDKYLLLNVWVLLAGISGAWMPVMMQGSGARGHSLVQIISGTLLAVFVAPALNEYFLASGGAQIHAGVSFMTGCFGLKLTEIFQRMIEQRGETVFARLLDRVTGGAAADKPEGRP